MDERPDTADVSLDKETTITLHGTGFDSVDSVILDSPDYPDLTWTSAIYDKSKGEKLVIKATPTIAGGPVALTRQLTRIQLTSSAMATVSDTMEVGPDPIQCTQDALGHPAYNNPSFTAEAHFRVNVS